MQTENETTVNEQNSKQPSQCDHHHNDSKIFSSSDINNWFSHIFVSGEIGWLIYQTCLLPHKLVYQTWKEIPLISNFWVFLPTFLESAIIKFIKFNIIFRSHLWDSKRQVLPKLMNYAYFHQVTSIFWSTSSHNKWDIRHALHSTSNHHFLTEK